MKQPELRQKLTTAESDRFEGGAEKYAAYLETPEGRLRLDLAFANLRDFLPPLTGSLRALDIGCGPGAIGVRLARLGIDVTLLDSSLPMLDLAKSTAQEAGVGAKTEVTHGDAAQVASLFPAESFDVILCHNVLEYVDDPLTVLRGVAHALRPSQGILSVMVRNQAGEVLKAGIQAGDLGAAEANLDAQWGQEALYGGKVRLFTSDGLRSMLQAAGLAAATERGVRVIVDYLPAWVSRTAEYDRIFELERKLGSRVDFAAVARYTQCLAHRSVPGAAASM